MKKYLPLFMIASLYLHAAEPRVILKPNRTLLYKNGVKNVEKFSEMFSKGEFYGRLRSNNFYWDWIHDENFDKLGVLNKKDNYAVGLGGSITYKSAQWKGWSTEIGMYVSESPFHMENRDIGTVKAGKDVTSRRAVYTDGNWALYSLAVANVAYSFAKSDIRIGRQIFESSFTKSNDTKMIPNTFEGVVFTSGDIDDTTLKAAYLTGQKLRDHKTFHDVITYGSYTSAEYNNDDSAAHRGLNVANLKAHGKDTHNVLAVVELQNTSVKNSKITLNYTAIPALYSLGLVEGSYKYALKQWTLQPAVRYIQQFDHGGGAVGGANILGNASGYTNPTSLDTWMVAAKIELKNKTTRLRLGYSQVADKADLVVPWRGFPTAGYTRAMGQYNWFANTKTILARIDYSFDKAGSIKGLSAMFRYAYEDFDDKKKTAIRDSNVYNFDCIYHARALAGFETRFRIAYVDMKKYDTGLDLSYIDSRLEFNYLF